MRVAIIGGSGKMEQWFGSFLKEDGKDIIIADRNEGRLFKAKQQLGIEATTDLSSAVDGADIVILSVPINSFEAVVKQLAPYVNTDQTVIDITSVKAHPVEVMHRYFKTGSVLGTHPVFGPGAKGVRNQNFVLTPTNEKETALAQKFVRYLEEREARVTLMTPQEHDEMIAIILGLSHFIAIASADTLLNFNQLKQMAAIAGPSYKVLLTLAESVITEDPELYAAIQMSMPRIIEIEEMFLKSSKRWADIVKNKDKQGFINRMNTLKEKLEHNDPDFGKPYNDMYRMLEGL